MYADANSNSLPWGSSQAQDAVNFGTDEAFTLNSAIPSAHSAVHAVVNLSITHPVCRLLEKCLQQEALLLSFGPYGDMHSPSAVQVPVRRARASPLSKD